MDFGHRSGLELNLNQSLSLKDDWLSGSFCGPVPGRHYHMCPDGLFKENQMLNVCHQPENLTDWLTGWLTGVCFSITSQKKTRKSSLFSTDLCGSCAISVDCPFRVAPNVFFGIKKHILELSMIPFFKSISNEGNHEARNTIIRLLKLLDGLRKIKILGNLNIVLDNKYIF